MGGVGATKHELERVIIRVARERDYVGAAIDAARRVRAREDALHVHARASDADAEATDASTWTVTFNSITDLGHRFDPVHDIRLKGREPVMPTF